MVLVIKFVQSIFVCILNDLDHIICLLQCKIKIKAEEEEEEEFELLCFVMREESEH